MAKAKNNSRKELVKSIKGEELRNTLGEKAWNATMARQTGMNGLLTTRWNKSGKYTNDQWNDLPEQERMDLAFASMDGRTKQRCLGEFFSCVMALPEVRENVVQAVIQDPLAGMRILTALMPKDVNVEVTETRGVVVLPTPKEWREWEAKANAINGEVIDAEDEDPWESIRGEG